ncbi:MATE family efflux transporter [candidate division KSB1 bacterium]|nr:MATE family efflux transporter [candidate division KSB1 bacterium]RQW01341.1 MAG: MATE family efflux transporter [candidate division KSB1 bacterium]
MPLRKFFKTSLPAAIDLSSQTIMWTIEAIYIGKLGASALAGHSMAIQIVLVFFALLLTFVIGAGLIINRHLGANDVRQANHIFGQAMMMGIILAILFAIIWHSGAVHLFHIIKEDGGASARAAGIIYLQTVAFFGPLIMINFVATGILRAIGDTRYSMFVNLTVNGINVVLAPILIFGLFGIPALQVKGAAIAVGIAHSIGFAISFYLVRSKKTQLYLSFKELTTPNFKSFKELFKMGLPTTVEQLTWGLGQLVVISFAGAVSVVILSTHAIFMRIQNVLSMVYMGFGLAAMSQMGKNLGADDKELAESAAHTAHRAMALFIGITVLLMIVFSKAVIHVFTTDAATVALGQKAIFIFAFAQIPKALNNVLSGNLRGIGMLHWLMFSTIAFVVVFEIGFNYISLFILGWGLYGMWGIQAADETIRLLLNYLRFKNGSWRRKKGA